jgi:hypothetical protein
MNLGTHANSAMLSGYGRGAITSPQLTGAGLSTGVPPFAFVDVSVMRKSELLEFHEREAARYRRLLASVTTPALRARLAEQAREHERLVDEINDELILADA